jgi:hypothetical protein
MAAQRGSFSYGLSSVLVFLLKILLRSSFSTLSYPWRPRCGFTGFWVYQSSNTVFQGWDRVCLLGSSEAVALVWARGLSLEVMRLSLSCIWWTVGSNHAASIQLMSMSLIQPAFVMSLSEIRNHGVADVASAAVVTRSIKLMQFSTMYQLIR